jgi:hypothetical protein
MWVGFFHLTVGNAIIGIGEGVLIGRLFRGNYGKTVFAMIAANYLSMFIAVVLLDWRGTPMSQHLTGVTFENVGRVLLVATLLCILGSAVFEWPFCWLGLHGAPRRFRNSFLAVVVAQLASYAVLIPWYASAGSFSALTGVERTDPAEFAKDAASMVYFVDAATGDLCRVRANGAGRETVVEADFDDPLLRLYAVPTDDRRDVQVWARWGRRTDEAHVFTLPIEVALRNDVRLFGSEGETIDDWGWSSKAIDQRPMEERPWRIRFGHWAGEGLSAEHVESGETVRIALETPFLNWRSRRATVLPCGQVIYQLGDQVVLLDLDTRRLGVLAYGRGPLVIPGAAFVASDESDPGP